jgi:hypothetical protein
MNMFGRTIGIFAVLSSVFSIPAIAQEVNVKGTVLTRPADTTVSFGDVYGAIKYNSNLKDTKQVTDFLNVLIDEQFGSEAEGSFLVTLAVAASAAAKPIAERPIMSGTRKDKKFLWITTQRSLRGDVDVNGTLIDNVIVQNDNNSLRVSLKVHASDKVTFDTKSYADLLKIADAARAAAGFIAVPQLITGNTDTIAKLIDTALSREKSEDKTLASEMSFINVSGLNADNISKQSANKQRFDITASGDEGSTRFSLVVEFETKPSNIGEYDPKKSGSGPNRKGFSDWAVPGKFIDRATVQVGTEKISVIKLLESAGPKTIATAWTMLESPVEDGKSPYDPKKNANKSIEAVCKEIWSALRNAYTERDAVGLYWDILHQLRTGLAKTPGAIDCVKYREALFAYHGLKVDSLKEIKN